MASSHSSLCVAVSLDHAFAVAFDRKILLLKKTPLQSNVDCMAVISEAQSVGALAFAKAALESSLSLVSAGEDKMINFYDVNAVLGGQEETKPWYTYGPHTKRITHIATCDDGTVIFCDKFGEVHLLDISTDESRENAKRVGTRFLLQHFSFFSCLFISNRTGSEHTSSRRLFTCDGDCRVRVSNYPDVFLIEQFLWYDSSPSVTTAVTELVPSSSSPANRTSFYALGHHDGSVSFWKAVNSVTGSTENSIALQGVYTPPATSDKRSVVGLCQFEDGVLAAYDSTQMIFIPVNISADNVSILSHQVHTFSLPQPGIAMKKCGSSTALAVTRDGLLRFVCVSKEDGAVKLSLSTENVDAVGVRNFSLGNTEGKSLLWDVNVEDQWKTDAKDPRARKRNHESDGDDEEKVN